MLNNLPKVSVIVPCYNHERYVKKCIESIVSQTYPNVELIVIDDGSKDQSPTILKDLATQHNFIFVQQANRGLTGTINRALKEFATGKYICYCASDDFYTENRLEKQVDFMESHPETAFAYSKVYLVDENSNQIGEVKVSGKAGWVFEDLFLGKLNFPALSCIYDRVRLMETELYDETLMIEDSDIWYKLTQKYQVGFIDIYSGYYRRHESNMTRRRVAMYKDTLKRLEKYKTNPLYRKAVLNTKAQFFFYFSFEQKKEALALLKDIFPYRIFSKFFIAGVLNLLGFRKLLSKYNR